MLLRSWPRLLWHDTYYLCAPNLGFLVLGVAALVRGLIGRKRTEEGKLGAGIWLFVALTLSVWSLLMFGPAKTTIYQSSYVMILFASVGSVLLLWSVKPGLAWSVAALQMALNAYLFADPYTPQLGRSPEGSLQCGVCLACFRPAPVYNPRRGEWLELISTARSAGYTHEVRNVAK